MVVQRSNLPQRLLNFDIETRKVGFHSAGRFAPDGCEPTAIAVSWFGEDRIDSRVIHESQQIPGMLKWFRGFYDEADILVGHYIRKFDLKVLNAAYLEWGLEPLTWKKAWDTKLDLIDFAGISKSQDNLGDMLRLQEHKFQMNDTAWRRATRLTPTGQNRARRRVRGDVRQNKEMFTEMHNRKMLHLPKTWRP